MLQGYLVFEEIECVYSKLDDCIIVTPKNKSDIRRMYQLATKTNFILKFEHYIYKNSFAYIEKIVPRLDKSFNFITKYSVALIGDYEISGFKLTGDDIDVFFSPTTYFFQKKRNNEPITTELLYNREEVNKFNFTYNNVSVFITLYFGEILREGIRSDLVLHPQLRVEFAKTKDINFIFGVYMTIVKFLQLVRHQKNYNLKHIDIYGHTEKVEESYLGTLYSKPYVTKYFSKFSESEYIYFEPYVNQLLQLISDDSELSIRHLPLDGSEIYSYDVLRYLSVFSAFEYECKKAADELLGVSDEPFKNVKKDLLQSISRMKYSAADDNEKRFLEDAHNSISRLGTQIGQQKKIINAYNKSENILRDSMKFLFPKGFKIKSAASNLAKLRGKIAHDNLCRELTEKEIEEIRFMDVLSYVLFLKRAGVDDNGIELIIGAIFQCNYKYMEYSTAERNNE